MAAIASKQTSIKKGVKNSAPAVFDNTGLIGADALRILPLGIAKEDRLPVN